MISAKSSVGFHRPRSLVATEWVCLSRLFRRPPDEDEGLLVVRRGWRFSDSVTGVITDGNATVFVDDPSSAKQYSQGISNYDIQNNKYASLYASYSNW